MAKYTELMNHLWRVRNSKSLQGNVLFPSGVVGNIIRDIRASLCSCSNVPPTDVWREIGMDWNVSLQFSSKYLSFPFLSLCFVSVPWLYSLVLLGVL